MTAKGRPIHGRTYGQPGGIYVRYELSPDQREYTVTNEDGERLDGFAFETDAQHYCEDIIAREKANAR